MFFSLSSISLNFSNVVFFLEPSVDHCLTPLLSKAGCLSITNLSLLSIIFVVLLLFVNLAGWGWAVWQNREIAAHPSVSPVLAFALGRNELQLLDIAKASEHVAPRVMVEIAMQSTGQEASALQSGAGPAPDALAEKVSEIWCGL